MELKEFISETLRQIVEGVAGAQNHARECGAVVNPTDWVQGKTTDPVRYQPLSGPLSTGPEQRREVLPVEFDVAVTASEGTSKKGGIGISVASVFSAEGAKESTAMGRSVSRVKFRVSVLLPLQSKKPADPIPVAKK